MVYVEGDDDIPFWNYYFPSDICQIECVGGCENLTEKIDNIERGLLKCIVACDADYSFYHDDVQEHKLVVRTESHSIECLLYCPYKLNYLLQKHSRRIVDFTPSIISKYQQFETDIEELVLYDITNDVYKKGMQILANVFYIMKSQHVWTWIKYEIFYLKKGNILPLKNFRLLRIR